MPRSQLAKFQIPLVAAALLGLTLPLLNPAAHACAVFSRKPPGAKQAEQPSLTREKVLIIHDADRAQQHFIREVAFRKADQPFGFVVPTPTRPEVAEVEHSPFPELRKHFRFEQQPRSTSKNAIGSDDKSARGVEVMSVDKVGSFTAFVLAATDAAALSTWLKDNELSNTPATEQWLDHYVRMGFYYVAMRYDPPSKAEADAAIVAETIRISFATPVAYYPYFEPSASAASSEQRLLELWYVGSDPVVPVTRIEADAGSVSWANPFQPGQQFDSSRGRTSLEAALADELEQLLPAGDLVVQTFQDQKRSRDGFHDVLFAFDQSKQLTPEQLAALEPLLGVLDPSLIEEGK